MAGMLVEVEERLQDWRLEQPPEAYEEEHELTEETERYDEP